MSVNYCVQGELELSSKVARTVQIETQVQNLIIWRLHRLFPHLRAQNKALWANRPLCLGSDTSTVTPFKGVLVVDDSGVSGDPVIPEHNGVWLPLDSRLIIATLVYVVV